MNDPEAAAFAWGALAGVGALVAALFNKLKLSTKNSYVLPSLIWTFGFASYVAAEKFVERHSAEWTFLVWAAFIFMGIGASVTIFNMAMGKTIRQPKYKEKPIEESFGYRIGHRLGKWHRKQK